MRNTRVYKVLATLGITIAAMIILTVMFIILWICSATGEGLFHPSTSQHLASLASETEDISAYYSLGLSYDEENKIDWYDVLSHNEIEGDLGEILVVYDDRIFFVVDNFDTWSLLSVNEKGENPVVHLEESFTYTYNDGNYYDISINEDYWRYQTGFYHQGKIVLTNHTKLVEYDIESDEYVILSALEYNYPQDEVNVMWEDYRTLHVRYKNIQRTVTPEMLMQSSKAFTSFMELDQLDTRVLNSRLDNLFAKVQPAGKYLYIICCAYNWNGEASSVIFQYDIEENDCDYSFYHYLSGHDRIDEKFYLIPKDK